jgi:hypothetical protein
VATALLDGCSEFLTLDGRIKKKESKFATAIPKLKKIGLAVLRPSQTNSLPNEYRTDDLFKGKDQEAAPGKP